MSDTSLVINVRILTCEITDYHGRTINQRKDVLNYFGCFKNVICALAMEFQIGTYLCDCGIYGTELRIKGHHYRN